MKNIKLSYFALIAALTFLWLVSDTVLSTNYEFFALRTSLLNYSGIICIGAMSVGLILAVKPVRLEPFLGGLDKAYRLHKWLGITGLAAAIIHWLLVKAPNWMTGWGWIGPTVRKPAAEQSLAIFAFFQSQRGLAKTVGEWAFYAAIVLIVLALLKRFPYRYFRQTHRLLPIIFLFLVFHAVVMMKYNYWGEVIGPVMAVLMAMGTAAALVSLFRKVGHNRQYVGIIDEITYHKDNKVLDVGIKINGMWSGHIAGQFAFVTFKMREGSHPFTISSSWKDDGKVHFHIKGIGDYTSTLPNTLKIGDPVKVEGPYGRFSFESNKPRQIWVAGGIGITPFISQMQALSKKTDGKTVDFFYCTSVPDEGYISHLRKLAEEAKVKLHILVTQIDGKLNAERLCQLVPEWKTADIWFCGPAGFGQTLRNDFAARGLSHYDFHQELFDMR